MIHRKKLVEKSWVGIIVQQIGVCLVSGCAGSISGVLYSPLSTATSKTLEHCWVWALPHSLPKKGNCTHLIILGSKIQGPVHPPWPQRLPFKFTCFILLLFKKAIIFTEIHRLEGHFAFQGCICSIQKK